MPVQTPQSFQIKLADTVIGIDCLFGDVRELCREYITHAQPEELHIAVTPEDIELERSKTLEQHKRDRSAAEPGDGYLETLAVYRKLTTALVSKQTLLIHGSVVAVGNKAFMFTARSGVGKTTHTRLWLKNVPGSYVVNGDKPLIRIADIPVAYGTPWCGKERLQTPCAVPLEAIVLLERGDKNEMTPISASEAFPTLLSQTCRQRDAALERQTLELLHSLTSSVSFYRLRCNMSPEAAAVSSGVLLK